MIVTVKAAGEECADGDKFVQPITSNTLANLGVQQKENIILKPDYPLLVALGVILILSTALIMVLIAFCLRKGWVISELRNRSYRDLYFNMRIDHSAQETYDKQNEFKTCKSEILDSDEDDIDNMNLDIHHDLVATGQKYLSLFDKTKGRQLERKNKKKREIRKLLLEIEQIMTTIGNSALGNGMTWFDFRDLEDTNGLTEEQI